jgi:hypothetical protein
LRGPGKLNTFLAFMNRQPNSNRNLQTLFDFLVARAVAAIPSSLSVPDGNFLTCASLSDWRLFDSLVPLSDTYFAKGFTRSIDSLKSGSFGAIAAPR